ncbi:sugar ABC transporter ATP-binding protein [Chitinasiproducens palmae]|uniref:Monosaccharide ABC transporter ATP-binding protein, CUT2 family n=1 Tax=Chitinasiproducens palmae TaxID=1770053 RepID=A0A1H2PK98_9BURK|nr:sugar ABC transporter ATP-binding protein [Chitinasiproducens palmae]SDV46831.1 monosaccharide ABC transporter ATP-binding protein, CUT2 family [Chitinasiproducens palmae]
MNPSLIHPGADEPALLEVRGLSKRFGATRALAGVSLRFAAGRVHCVLGENGAGKSTLGKLIGGLYDADEGEMLLDGRPIRPTSPRDARAAGIAIVHQELALAPHLSVRANLWLGSEARRAPFAFLPRQAETARAREVMNRLGLAHIDTERRLSELPMAVHQLVEIGRSLMFDPRVIVFDEPTAMLGAVEKQRFFEVVRALKADGIAAILITHHTDDVVETADHVTVMRDGRVVDSFAMHDAITGETVVARLTGTSTGTRAEVRPVAAATTCVSENLPPPPVDRDPLVDAPMLEIEGLASDADDDTLRLAAGQIVGFYGVVGCGAEKIVQGLVGLHAAGSPLRFRLAGRAYRPRSPAHALAQGVAYLPAGRARNGVLPSRSIRDNLLLTQWPGVGRWGFVAPSRERALARALLGQCGVKFDSDDSPITSLSGGNQQKVLLARAMAGASRLLLLEEPSAGVDIDAKRQIHARVRALAERGVTVLVLSSDLPETLTLCDTVMTMFDGRIVGRYDAPGAHDHAAIVADVLGQRPLHSAHLPSLTPIP